MDPMQAQLATVGEFMELCAKTAQVNGFLAEVEGYLLYLLARHGGATGAIVEIGSFEGRSTAFLALGAKMARRERVHAVDTFQGSPEHQPGGEAESATLIKEGATLGAFKRNLSAIELADWVTPIVSDSVGASENWSGPIRLLFIDGNHDFEHVAADFHAWSPHVVPGGYIVFHDYGNSPDVVRFCDETVRRSEAYQARYLAGSALAFQYIA